MRVHRVLKKITSATFCGDRACLVRFDFQMQPFAEIVSITRNAGEVLPPDFQLPPSAEIVHCHHAECRASYPLVIRMGVRDLRQVVLYRIPLQRSWCGHFAQEILIQRSCAYGPTGSSCKDPDYRDLAQVVLHQKSGPLAQYLCMRICCAKSLCQDHCIRIM